jgi:hypothetical protein
LDFPEIQGLGASNNGTEILMRKELKNASKDAVGLIAEGESSIMEHGLSNCQRFSLKAVQ